MSRKKLRHLRDKDIPFNMVEQNDIRKITRLSGEDCNEARFVGESSGQSNGRQNEVDRVIGKF